MKLVDAQKQHLGGSMSCHVRGKCGKKGLPLSSSTHRQEIVSKYDSICWEESCQANLSQEHEGRIVKGIFGVRSCECGACVQPRVYKIV